MIQIDYKSKNKKVKFSEIKDKEYFYSSGSIYIKILKQDLELFGISNINACSKNGGLTFFEDDEEVKRILIDERIYN